MRISTIFSLAVMMISYRLYNTKALLGKLKFRQNCNTFQSKVVMSSSKASDFVTEQNNGEKTFDFNQLINQHRQSNSPKKLLKSLQEMSGNNEFKQEMVVTSLRTFQRLNRTDLIPDLVPLWVNSIQNNSLTNTEVDLKVASSLLREICRLNRMDLAQTICDLCHYEEAPLSSSPTTRSSTDAIISYNISNNFIETNEKLSFQEQILADLALGYTFNNSFNLATISLEKMINRNLTIDNDTSKKILKHFLKESDTFYVRKVLRNLIRLKGLKDNDSVQLLSNTFMKSIDFVKGAVSMDTLPPLKNAEVAFIGRSNVGKSSLLNMICNRKALAYISKTPGKTSEFNYFDANGNIGKKHQPHQFFLVDLPGVGYAEVRYEKRRSWLNLLKTYVEERPSLRVLFHLIDSRHGLLESDNECLDLLRTLPAHVQYVIVLTKADKRGGGMKTEMVDMIYNKLSKRMKTFENYPNTASTTTTTTTTTSLNPSEHVIDNATSTTTSSVADEIGNNFNEDPRNKIPILLTSSESKQGGVELWSIMLDAVAGDDASKLFFENVNRGIQTK